MAVREIIADPTQTVPEPPAIPPVAEAPATPAKRHTKSFTVCQFPKRQHEAKKGAGPREYPIAYYWEAVARLDTGDKVAVRTPDYGNTTEPANEQKSVGECLTALHKALMDKGFKGPADVETKTHDIDPSPAAGAAYNRWLANQ